jgi:hypothetical protein
MEAFRKAIQNDATGKLNELDIAASNAKSGMLGAEVV